MKGLIWGVGLSLPIWAGLICIGLALSGCAGSPADQLAQSIDGSAAADQQAALTVAKSSGNKAAIDCVDYLVSVAKEPCGPGQTACYAIKTALYAQAPLGECAAFNAQVKATFTGLIGAAAKFGL